MKTSIPFAGMIDSLKIFSSFDGCFYRVLQPGMLLFDSHFECGNLNSAYLVTSNRDSERASANHSHSFYDLYMNEDVTSAAGAQWFYFSVSGNRAKQKVTFSIRNFYKPESLFNEGMRPLVLSLKGATCKSGESRVGWTRYNPCMRCKVLSLNYTMFHNVV